MPPSETPDPRVTREIANLRQENERLRQRIVLLGRLGRQIASSLDLPTVLQNVVNAACELTGARYGALGAFDSSGRIVQFTTHGISAEERARIGALPQGLGILGWLQELRQPLRLADLGKHPRSVGFPPNHPRMRTFLGAPILDGGESLGNLYLTEKQGGDEFTPEDTELLVLFAAQAAIAIRNARLHLGVEEERARLQAVVGASPVGVVLVEAGTERVLLANEEIKRIVGTPRLEGETLERSLRTVVYRRPDGRPFAFENLPLQRALKRGETVRAEEFRFVFPDGRTVPTLVNATPIRSADGTISGAIGIIQDMTPMEELEKLRGEFLGMVSHELKTPLTAIKGSAAMVLGSERPIEEGETRELFQIIDEQADRLRDLVDNLLDMTRIEAGALSVKADACDLMAIAEDARATFARGGGAHEIVLRAPEGLPPVKADRRRITQVLGNLLNNAAKFSPATAPVTIAVEQAGDQVTVRVRDQGRGIPKDQLPHLFKKFSQIHPDSAPRLSGSGLGLAICKGIVEAHGGRIWAESDGEGKGATFGFTLAVAAGEAPAPAADVTRRTDHVGRVRRPGERTRILAVDDDLSVQRLLQRVLDEAGYRPILTGDPAQLVRLAEREEPDLVLLDVMLPGATGFDLLKRLREFSGVPVIFLTARDRDEDMVKALKMGADDYITKPFSTSELLARIEAALRRRVLPDQTEVRPPFALADLAVNFTERRVTVGGQPVSLSATEYKLLYELATNAGRVLTHEQILHKVWGPEYSGETELVRSFIRNLRRKLGDDARNPRFIHTEPQVGYRMPRA